MNGGFKRQSYPSYFGRKQGAEARKSLELSASQSNPARPTQTRKEACWRRRGKRKQPENRKPFIERDLKAIPERATMYTSRAAGACQAHERQETKKAGRTAEVGVT